MSATSAVAFDGVWYAYDERPVLRDVNLTIPRGGFATVIGPNGGGKTTLIRLALGLLKPTRGQVRVLGTAPEAARSRIGYMPQRTQIDPGFPALVEDVVLTGRLGPGGGPYTPADRAAASRALDRVGLAAARGQSFSTLSGGQRQRALIARAIAADPELLLLDEPTANLDVTMEKELYDLLVGLAGTLTIVLVSHDLGFVSPLAETVVCVKGTVAVHPTCELTGEAIREMYGHEVRAVRHDRGCGGGATP